MLTGLHFRLAYNRLSKRAHRCLYLLLLAMLLISLVMNAGCSSYAKYTTHKESVRFSFEYPRSYEEMSTYEFPFLVMVSFDRSIVEENQLLERSYLCVTAREASLLDNPDAKAALEDEIAKFATNKNNRDFEIIDRSPVTIAGLVGERVEFSYCHFRDDPFIDYEGPYVELPITSIVRCAYFDHDGFVWAIFLKSTEGLAEEDKAHFEHILETFTILE